MSVVVVAWEGDTLRNASSHSHLEILVNVFCPLGMGHGLNLQSEFSGLNATKITASLRENEREDFIRLTSKESVY